MNAAFFDFAAAWLPWSAVSALVVIAPAPFESMVSAACLALAASSKLLIQLTERRQPLAFAPSSSPPAKRVNAGIGSLFTCPTAGFPSFLAARQGGGAGRWARWVQ